MADIPTVALNENSPAGSDNIALGDNRIREYKTQNREILEVDHDYPSSGQSATAGQHKQVTLQEAADIGTGAEGVPILGAQTVSGKAELMFTDEDNNDIQISSNGKLKISSGRLENNTNLIARNAAGDGDLNLLKANASNQAEHGLVSLFNGGVLLPEITAPTTAANQGAIYTKNDGTQTELYFKEESDGDEVQITKGGTLNGLPSLGSWVDKSSSYGAQQATTDGFIVVRLSSGGTDGSAIGYTDSNSNPTTARIAAYRNADQQLGGNDGFMMPVKKNDYWKVVLSGTSTVSVYWIPLGS